MTSTSFTPEEKNAVITFSVALAIGSLAGRVLTPVSLIPSLGVSIAFFLIGDLFLRIFSDKDKPFGNLTDWGCLIVSVLTVQMLTNLFVGGVIAANAPLISIATLIGAYLGHRIGEATLKTRLT
ncbi:MAG: hypothetical protein H0X51_02660 [Parachlamydiaceae bacterium]|nr:hypothetical protein [Parachlamydiaceae bacterium]